MISTTNIPLSGGSTPKTIQPGNNLVTVTSIGLEKVPYKADGYNLVLNVVGPDLGSDFEGFFIDKNVPEKGRYSGQIGKIKMSEYAYADGETKSGIKIYRDLEILKAVRNLCTELDCVAWLEKQNNQHETIESLIDQMNMDKSFDGKVLNICVAGKEYKNKAGYTNYDLFVPRADKGLLSFQNAAADTAKIMMFNPSVHIKKIKEETIQSFGDSSAGMDVPTSNSVASDFKF